MSDEPNLDQDDPWPEHLVAARLRSGKTQSELAEQLGMSQSAVADWEKGKTRPRAHLWERIDRLLGSDLQRVLVSRVRLITPKKRRTEEDQSRFEWLDMPETRRLSTFLSNFDFALRKADIEMDRLKFANTAFRSWLNQTRNGSLRTQEARLTDAIEASIEYEKQWLEATSTTIEEAAASPERKTGSKSG